MAFRIRVAKGAPIPAHIKMDSIIFGRDRLCVESTRRGGGFVWMGIMKIFKIEKKTEVYESCWREAQLSSLLCKLTGESYNIYIM